MLVEGGKTRFYSVKNAFRQITSGNADLVLIHDAARPNVSSRLIGEILDFASKKGNTALGTKLSDTVKKENKGIILQTIDRSNLWTVQTPQVFKYKDLKLSYQKSRSDKYTDESSLVESAGFRVSLFEGPNENVKLTSLSDLKLLKKLMG